MDTIVRLKFGSHLYGTSTPQSDVDYKSVFIPPAKDILLGTTKRTISSKRTKQEGEKNRPGEIDEEAYSLQNFLRLAAEGQTVALDVLFAPPSVYVEPAAPQWDIIAKNRHRLLTRKSASFVGYCRQQANKYGIKGSRVAAARGALQLLEHEMAIRGTTVKLSEISSSIESAVAANEHMALIPIEQIGGQVINHWDVCGRKLCFTASIKMARDTVQKLVDEYGARALQAEKQEGVDWKALSHAVRVGRQAIELLTTANVTFPLPDAAHILAIKTGQLPYQAVSAEIEDLLERVELEAQRSSLPLEPDHAWIEAFILETYRNQVRRRI